MDPSLYYSTQSSSPSEAHGSATSQTASVSSTSQLSTTPSCIYPTISTTTFIAIGSHVTTYGYKCKHEYNDSCSNCLVDSAQLHSSIGQFNFNSSSQLPLNASQTQPSTSVSTVTSNCPFEIKFLTPAIKICAGCRKGYARASDGKNCLPPPNDLCLVHKEQHLYYNVPNGRQQLSSLSNVHYHANMECLKVRFANFVPSAVLVPNDLKHKLLEEHKVFLLQTFNITIA